MQLLSQGAEAKVFHMEFLGEDAVLKQRVPKSYRHPDLEAELTSRRIKEEAKTYLRCLKAGLNVPAVLDVDVSSGTLILEYIHGEMLKRVIMLNQDRPDYKAHMLKLGELMGTGLARMHDANIIHGDLTTSNMLLRHDEDSRDSSILYFIDFGLSFVSTMDEDKAVDLYVLERCFTSSHPHHTYVFQTCLEAYGKASKKSKSVLERLKQVEKRGRKRDMIG